MCACTKVVPPNPVSAAALVCDEHHNCANGDGDPFDFPNMGVSSPRAGIPRRQLRAHAIFGLTGPEDDQRSASAPQNLYGEMLPAHGMSWRGRRERSGGGRPLFVTFRMPALPVPISVGLLFLPIPLEVLDRQPHR